MQRNNWNKTTTTILEQKKKDIEEASCLIYPQNYYKANWDMFIAAILLYSCLTTPV